MRRKALLIGCCDESIKESVNNDLKNYRNFLMSPKGGAYNTDEIDCLFNENKQIIIDTIRIIKQNKYDIVFSVFTGHGEYDDLYKKERVLEIDDNNELYESDLINLSDKQILIIDTCAGLRSLRKKASYVNDSYNFNSNEEDISFLRYMSRCNYENKVLNCPKQLIRLYSCDRGEKSIGESIGGLYSYSLIETLSNSNNDINIVVAHNKAKEKVQKLSYYKQNPSFCVPKIHDTEFLPGTIIYRS